MAKAYEIIEHEYDAVVVGAGGDVTLPWDAAVARGRPRVAVAV